MCLKAKNNRHVLMYVMLLLLGISFAGRSATYNLNKEKGLPDNHVYGVIVDHNHYLWMATPKGAIRYNGYSMAIYDMSKGLPAEDIWFLKEDALERIWLCNISNELGYIKNGSYYAMITAHSEEVLYPKPLVNFYSGIAFLSDKYVNQQAGHKYLYTVGTDTFFRYDWIKNNANFFLLTDRELIMQANNDLYRISPSLSGLNIIKTPWTVDIRRYPDDLWTYGNYICALQYRGKDLVAINPENMSIRKVGVMEQDEVMAYACCYGNNLYIDGTRNVYVFDTSLHLVRRYPLPALCNNDKIDIGKPYVFTEDSFWAQLLCTYDKGIYITDKTTDPYRRVTAMNLPGFDFAGCINDSTCYWWNNTSEILAEVRNTRIIRRLKLSGVRDIRKILAYNKQYSILLNRQNVYWMNNYDNTIKSFSPTLPLNLPVDVIAKDNSTLYGVFKGTKGFCRTALKPGVAQEFYDPYNYIGVAYDSLRNGVWAYGSQRIFFHSIKTGKNIVVNSEMLRQFGIKKLEQFTIDNSYGNIIVKDYDRVLVFCPEEKKVGELVPEYRFTESLIRLHNNILVAVGKFGVLFSKISGKEKFSVPVIYANVKSVKYNNIPDVQIEGNEVLINSDKGLYAVTIPPDSVLTNNKRYEHAPYRFLTIYNNNAKNTTSPDTVLLEPGNTTIGFDVINPAGNGKLKFKYYTGIDKTWRESDAGELNLQHLKYGTYNQVAVTAYDNVWKSQPIILIVYIKPYWWQTRLWLMIFIIAGILALAALGITIYIVTKRNIIQKAERKNHLLALELKAIYSQINPHFIFNTLGTSLFLVKSNKNAEAYKHINKFSRLLRTYLKSSRQRLITLAEEVQNLKDYIELQQSRFVDKFIYELTIDDALDPSLIKIPSLLLQPLIENAIVHGLLNSKSPGILHITFVAAGHSIVICTIEDNGIGRDKARQINSQSSLQSNSIGTTLINDLIQLNNQYGDVKIDIAYIDKTLPETGTIVKITFKYYEQ